MAGWRTTARRCAHRSIAALAVALAAAAAVVGMAAPLDAAPGTTWKIATTPPPASSSEEILGVACAGSGVCWAVGQYQGASGWHVVIDQNSGSGWTRDISPGASAAGRLFGVTCSVSACWAVGSSAGDLQTLIEENTGSGWSVVASPTPANPASVRLQSVACASSSDCWAVGWYVPSGGSPQTVVEENVGAGWTLVSTPAVGGTSRFFSIACASANECYSVGHYFDSTGVSHTLVEQFTSGAWNVVSTPNPGDSDNVLFGVACGGPGACWAAGRSDNTGAPNQSLVLQRTVAGWATVTSANVSGAANELAGIACTSTTQCWAVGDSLATSAGALQRALVEDFNRGALNISSSANAPGDANQLLDVSCVKAGTCWAVGYIQNGLSLQPLVEANFRP
jgi:hypothetical protein